MIGAATPRTQPFGHTSESAPLRDAHRQHRADSRQFPTPLRLLSIQLRHQLSIQLRHQLSIQLRHQTLRSLRIQHRPTTHPCAAHHRLAAGALARASRPIRHHLALRSRVTTRQSAEARRHRQECDVAERAKRGKHRNHGLKHELTRLTSRAAGPVQAPHPRSLPDDGVRPRGSLPPLLTRTAWTPDVRLVSQRWDTPPAPEPHPTQRHRSSSNQTAAVPSLYVSASASISVA